MTFTKLYESVPPDSLSAVLTSLMTNKTNKNLFEFRLNGRNQTNSFINSETIRITSTPIGCWSLCLLMWVDPPELSIVSRVIQLLLLLRLNFVPLLRTDKQSNKEKHQLPQRGWDKLVSLVPVTGTVFSVTVGVAGLWKSSEVVEV